MRRAVAALLALSALALGCHRDEVDQALKARLVTTSLPGDVRECDFDFDGKVHLVGYSVSPKLGTYAPGSGVTVTFIWRDDVKLDAGYKLFTHGIAPNNEMVLNLDDKGPLRHTPGLAPSDWEPGHYYRDEITFTIPNDAPRAIAIGPGLVKGSDRLAVRRGGDKENRARPVVLHTSTADPASRVIKELDALHLLPSESIVVDGKLNEPAWARANNTGPFVDVGSGRPSPGAPTQGRAGVLWDDQFVYVGFEIFDKKVHGGWPSPTPAGAPEPHLWEKDTVEVMFDPDGDGDNKDYYELQISPQNLIFDTQYDAYNSPNGNGKGPFGHEEWSSKLTSAVVVHGTIDDDSDIDLGYTVEAKIPWASFTKAEHAPPRPGDTWRMNFYAMKNNGGTAWSPILGQGNFHRASRFGRVRWVVSEADAGAK